MFLKSVSSTFEFGGGEQLWSEDCQFESRPQQETHMCFGPWVRPLSPSSRDATDQLTLCCDPSSYVDQGGVDEEEQ